MGSVPVVGTGHAPLKSMPDPYTEGRVVSLLVWGSHSGWRRRHIFRAGNKLAQLVLTPCPFQLPFPSPEAPLFRRASLAGEEGTGGGHATWNVVLLSRQQGTTRGRAPPCQLALGSQGPSWSRAERASPSAGHLWGSQCRDSQRRVTIPLGPLQAFSFWPPTAPR